jgi:molecular chaperone GrpE
MEDDMMSDHAKDDMTPVDEPAVEAAAEPGTEQNEISGNGDYEALVKLLAENEELKDRALRMAADMENLRRRTARDVHDARSYAISAFARDMLSVSDNLSRALDAIPAEARASGDAGFNALIEGVELTQRAMLAALERHGVKKLAPEGEKFDPNFHQAMFEVPNEDVPAGTVVQVVQPGYSIGERVLRPAMVGVSRGGPHKAAEAGASRPAAAPAEAEKDG